MISEEIAQHATALKTIEKCKVDPTVAETLSIAITQSARAEIIKQHVNGHTPLCGRAKGIDKASYNSTRFHQIHFQHDVAACTFYGAEH